MKSSCGYSLSLFALGAYRARMRSSVRGIVYDPTQAPTPSQSEQQLQKWATELQKWEQHLQKEEQIYTPRSDHDQIVTITTSPIRCPGCRRTSKRGTRPTGRSGRVLSRLRPNTYGNTVGVDERARPRRAYASARQAYNSAFVQAAELPVEQLLLARFPHPGHGPESVRHFGTGAEPRPPTRLPPWGPSARTSRRFATKLANLDSDTFSTDSSQQTELALLGKINSATLAPDPLAAGHEPASLPLPSSNSSLLRSSRSTPRTAPSTTPFTSSRTSPRPSGT